MPEHQNLVHLVAGGVGGTTGAILTSPLEVVKTRLQSSVATFRPYHVPTLVPVTHVASLSTCTCTTSVSYSRAGFTSPLSSVSHTHIHKKPVGIIHCLRYIVENEGARGLFKGLGPNLVGVAPSRAVYFCAYAKAKKTLNNNPNFKPESPLVHLCSAFCAGFSACTLTNPIWFVKTRLQLDQKRNNSLTVRNCVKQVYQTHGLLGFYKGITASYFGICETIIHFVIYEAIKARLLDWNYNETSDRRPSDFFELMFAGAVSKTCASIIAYPHEVARTRLRQEGTKYRSFFQTLRTVAHEEGFRALYRGLSTQLVRQIPNTAILMSTYELVVFLLTNSTAEEPM